MSDDASPRPERLSSLDALRGFDMFWIIGGDGIASAIGKLAKNPTVDAITAQVSDHVEWAGFRFYDMIFPLFLFIIGATLPFSIGRRLDEGANKTNLIKKILTRTAILIAFGLVYNGILDFQGWEHVRFFGVLQRQAFGYCCCAILFVTTKPRTQYIVFGAILLGYWALLAIAGHGDYTQWGNYANYVDRLILKPGQMYEKYGDPEGLVSMIPAICTALLGLFAGQWLKSDHRQSEKSIGLAAAGGICLVLGLTWSPYFPIIKKIWTSSYVLVAGGFSLLLLALAYWLVDVQGWRKLSLPFIVIGMNSITIYMLSRIVQFDEVADFFLGGVIRAAPAQKELIMAVGIVVTEWAVLYLLYKKELFLRV